MAKWHFGTYFWAPPEDYFLVASSATGLYGVFGRITFWSLKMPQNHCFHGISMTFWVVQASPEVSMVIPQIPSASQKQVILGFWVSFWSVFYWFLLISYWILLPGTTFTLLLTVQEAVFLLKVVVLACFDHHLLLKELLDLVLLLWTIGFSLWGPHFLLGEQGLTYFYC